MDTIDGAAPAAIREIVEPIHAERPQQQNLLLSFDRLVDTWPDRVAHQAFVYEATQAGELSFAGRLYRAVLARWPEDASAIAAQKQIATSAIFAGGLSNRGAGASARKIPRWVFMSGGMSLAVLAIDLTTDGTFSWIDVLMVLICVGSLGYVIYMARQR